MASRYFSSHLRYRPKPRVAKKSPAKRRRRRPRVVALSTRIVEIVRDHGPLTFAQLKGRLGVRALGHGAMRLYIGPIWCGLSQEFGDALHSMIWSKVLYIDGVNFRIHKGIRFPEGPKANASGPRLTAKTLLPQGKGFHLGSSSAPGRPV
jgi:hypothetical protein